MKTTTIYAGLIVSAIVATLIVVAHVDKVTAIQEVYNPNDELMFITDFYFPVVIENNIRNLAGVQSLQRREGQTIITMHAEATLPEINKVRDDINIFIDYAERIKSQHATVAGVNLPFTCARDRGRNEWVGIYVQNTQIQQIRGDPLCNFVFE